MIELMIFAADLHLQGTDPGLELLYAIAFFAGAVAGLLGRRR